MISRLQSERGSWTLIGVLIGTAIILVITVLLFTRTQRAWEGTQERELGNLAAGSNKTTVPGRSIDAAKNTECQNNLRQLRYAVSIYQNTQGGFPPDIKSVADAGGIKNPEMLKCALGGEPYAYDPATGNVRCVHPGHERF